MKTKKIASVGALHPILFFAVMYFVVLFFSIFICSSLFYSCSSSASADTVQKSIEQAPPKAEPANTPGTVALR
jgi:hypothetical protein